MENRPVEIIVRSRVRQLSEGLYIGKDIFEALDLAVAGIISKAVQRAKKNNRKTLQGRDI